MIQLVICALAVTAFRHCAAAGPAQRTTGVPPPACPVNPPMHPGTEESCEAFCSGRCSFHPDYAPGRPVNLTAYRLTAAKMLKYGVGNKDTGDAAGDVGFYMERFMSLVGCAPPWTSHGCFLDESPVIQQFVIEADGVWGPYLKCNPLTTSEGVPILDEPFLCDYGNQGPPGSVEDPEEYGHGIGGCNCKRANKTVGVDPAHHMMAADCKPQANGTWSRNQIACLFGGWWYSTPIAGECPAGTPLGTNGCTWRTISQPKTVNDTGCMAHRMTKPLLIHNQACFSKLPTQPPVPSTPGFGKCFTDAIVGNADLDPIAPALLIQSWEKAFTLDDPAQGGCPNIKGDLF